MLPNPGASIAALTAKLGDRWIPVMRPTPAQALALPKSGQMASFNLAPWSNRIVGAAFSFQEKPYALRANTPQGFAIHGDARERPWHVDDHRGNTLTCSIDSREFPDFNFPFPFTAAICYELNEATLATSFRLNNVGNSAMPAGWGFHPYFNRRLSDSVQDHAQLELYVEGVYPPLPGMTASMPPTIKRRQKLGELSPMFDVPDAMDFSKPAEIGERDIDHCFGGWDGRAAISYPLSGVRLVIDCDPVLGHVIVYTPPGKSFFAVEPVTHANDGFNMLARGIAGNGIRVLQPGEQLNGVFRIHVTA
ncbi:MAG: aldose 1-epimerase [Chloroflexi bacterium]|nr:aldose 1-epimerase [Chloroflexota bacterium]